jgi:hypothetical protein
MVVDVTLARGNGSNGPAWRRRRSVRPVRTEAAPPKTLIQKKAMPMCARTPGTGATKTTTALGFTR